MPDTDAPSRDELVPTGGTWSGLLFDNPQTGYDLKLTWTFTFVYESVRREYGDTEPHLTIDWVPFEEPNWRRIEGNFASAQRFADPIEASVYFFEHYRYANAAIRVVEQHATDVLVTAEVRGDIDGLGLPGLYAEQWLRFDGIFVQPSVRPESLEAAELLLAEFTDTTGLSGADRKNIFVFESVD